MQLKGLPAPFYRAGERTTEGKGSLVAVSDFAASTPTGEV